jgi:hypothetical protein
VETAARIVVRNGLAKREGALLWPVSETLELRARSPVDGDPATERKLEHIAPEEIVLAMQQICRDGSGVERDALLLETARVFGVHRMGRIVADVLQAVLDKAVEEGDLLESDGKLTAP